MQLNCLKFDFSDICKFKELEILFDFYTEDNLDSGQDFLLNLVFYLFIYYTPYCILITCTPRCGPVSIF